MRDVIHVRGLGDIARQARVCAAERGITLRELVIRALTAEVGQFPTHSRVPHPALALPPDAPAVAAPDPMPSELDTTPTP